MIELVGLHQAGRFPELERRARDLSQRSPQAGLAWKALAVALKMQGKESLPAAHKAAELLPQDAEAQTNLGVALWEAARVPEAISCLQRAIRIRPDDPSAHYRLGSLLLELGRLEDAAVCYQRVAQLNPNVPEVRFGLGNIQRALGRLDQAASNFRRALELQPRNSQICAQLGITLRLMGRTDEADATLAQALELEPTMTAAMLALADVRADRGQFADAETRLRQALSVNPNLAEAWAGLARLRPMTTGDAGWLESAQRLVAGPLRPREAISLHYAIGKYFDDTGDYEQAFDSFRRANELTRLHTRRYDPAQLTQTVDRFIELFDQQWLAQTRTVEVAAERAVLVVGMPRSGTALIEQILVAHPAAFGAGELMYWNDASRYYHTAVERGEGAAAVVARLGTDYLRLLQQLSADAQRVVDRTARNFMFLGLLHAALPGARIIHVQRNPVDTCLSMYTQDFGAMLACADDLDDLAHYYGQYQRLMRHWRQLLPQDAMLELSYEQLIAGQEAGTRRLLEFVGLPWDPRCLDFHAAERSVVAMSRWQLRQKLNAASIGRWRNYARHLGPLLKLMDSNAAAAGVATEAGGA